jgi:two-component system LytT family response regulator
LSPITASAKDLLNPSPISILLALRELTTRQISDVLQSSGGFHILGATESFPHANFFSNESIPEAIIIEDALIGEVRNEVASALSEWGYPPLILIVDQASQALEAFRLRAVDCLVKPLDRRKLALALRCIQEAVMLRRAGAIGEQIVRLFGNAGDHAQSIGRIPVRSNGRISFLRTEDVDWFEAQGDYVCIHARSKKHLIRGKISSMEQQLSPLCFVRTHRSIIVNIDRIVELQPLIHGDYAVLLSDGTRLALSRSYRPKVLNLLAKTSSA